MALQERLTLSVPPPHCSTSFGTPQPETIGSRIQPDPNMPNMLKDNQSMAARIESTPRLEKGPKRGVLNSETHLSFRLVKAVRVNSDELR